jgi:predicted alpha/beta-fold hydrolase
VPALIITAADDPFVPSEPFLDPRVTANPSITLIVSAHGGHCGFVAPASPQDDGYWAETRIVDFVERAAAADPAESDRETTAIDVDPARSGDPLRAAAR